MLQVHILFRIQIHASEDNMIHIAGSLFNGVYGNALQAASSGGHKEAVQMLLATDGDVNARGGRIITALQAASSGGHVDTVSIHL